MFVLSKEAYIADKSISYVEARVWPAKCNTIGRNAEKQLL